MATTTKQKDWTEYTGGLPVMECTGGPYDGWGYFVHEFQDRQRFARNMGYTGEDRQGSSLRYRFTGKTRQSRLRDFEGNPEAQVQVWVYADQPDML